MRDSTAPDSRELDEKLAAFADLALSSAAIAQPEMSADPELAELEKMVLRLNRAVGRRAPEPTLARKIWGNLAAEWKRSGPNAVSESAWSRLLRQIGFGPGRWASMRARQQVFALAAIAVVVIAVVIALPLLTSGIGNLPGAAGAGSFLVPAIAIGAFVLVGVVWLITRKRG